MKELKGKFLIENLGRGKVTKEVTVKNEDQFFKEIKPHLMSSDIEFIFNPKENKGSIIVGGFRPVGTFKKIEE